jgi:hypothetical protein
LFEVNMQEDGTPMIARDGIPIGRALTRQDGESIARAMNALVAGAAVVREKLLAEVTDAIENAFDGVA